MEKSPKHKKGDKDRMKFYRTRMNVLPQIFLMNREHLVPPVWHISRVAGEYILYFVLSGGLSMVDNGEKILLLPGDVHIFRKGEYHEPLESTECSYFYLHFEGDFTEVNIENEVELVLSKHNRFLTSSPYRKEYEDEIFLPKHIHIGKSPVYKRIVQLFEEGQLNRGMSKEEYYKTISALKAAELMITIYRYYASEKLEENERFGNDMIRRVISYLEMHSGEAISSELLEERFGYNFDYMNRRFKAVTGKTIFAYLRQLRINNAMVMLKLNNLSIAEVAEVCGFCDVYYFSRVFKEETGMTPAGYIDRKRCPVPEKYHQKTQKQI